MNIWFTRITVYTGDIKRDYYTKDSPKKIETLIRNNADNLIFQDLLETTILINIKQCSIIEITEVLK